MIRALRRRFILGAMAAFAILLMLLLGGIAVVGHIQVENTTRHLLEVALEGEDPPEDEDAAPGFGAPDMRGYGYYILTVDADGEITDVEERGIWESDLDAARAYGEQILALDADSGSVGGYRYLLHREADGSARAVLMDNSLQRHMLTTILCTGGLISLGCLAALFLILIPVSRQVMRSYAANIERQKQFITNAGHEIKTPVAIIRSNVDALELIQGESKWSRNIRGQTERLSALLQRMLFMARIDERSVTPPVGPVELDALIRAELEPYEEPMRERGIRFRCDLGGPLKLRGNREYLEQLVHMLLDNAVEYADAGGTISLSLEKRRGRARMTLENSVERLPDCAPQALFDRFYRGDSARTQTGGGYGIGLSAAQAIAEMHRGRITAEYVDAHTLRFVVELPLRG